MPEDNYISNPVMSIQSILRTVLFYDNDDISSLIPDGIYGPETTRAVKNFQEKHNLENSGVIDFNTWNVIIDEYKQTLKTYAPPTNAAIYPSADFTISPNEENPHLFVIQAMMNNIAVRYKNIPKNELNGIHDETSVNAVSALQKVFGMNRSGIINKAFWEFLLRLYEVTVTRNFMLDN